MRYVWDESKSQSNLSKHKVSFEVASLVFEDPYALSIPDDCDSEDRWLTIGLVKGVLILLVVHTSEDENHEEVIRIISARKATSSERKEYERQYRKS